MCHLYLRKLKTKVKCVKWVSLLSIMGEEKYVKMLGAIHKGCPTRGGRGGVWQNADQTGRGREGGYEALRTSGVLFF